MIRPATEADMPAIIRMSREFYAKTSYAEFAPYCVDSSVKLVRYLMRDGVMLVADREGHVCGMTGLAVVPFMFNNAILAAHEVIWWVDPGHRANGIGRELLAAIEPACSDKGCASIQMVTLANSPPHAAAAYEAHGYRHTETCYTRNI